MERLVSGRLPLEGDDPLVIKRLEYYFHHYVTPLDFSAPSAYQPRESWQREVDAMARGGTGDRDVLERIRRRAWRDEGETTINTRPVVWIGGDGIGVQNVLETPGLKDRNGTPATRFAATTSGSAQATSARAWWRPSTTWSISRPLGKRGRRSRITAIQRALP
jgi:hypothetical protein